MENKYNKHAYRQSQVRKSTGIEVQLIMSYGFTWLIWYGFIGLAVVVENGDFISRSCVNYPGYGLLVTTICFYKSHILLDRIYFHFIQLH